MLSSSLCPHTDMTVHVIDHVNAYATRLNIPRIEASETKVRVRRNITLANKKVLKKGQHPTVKCQVQVPRMGTREASTGSKHIVDEDRKVSGERVGVFLCGISLALFMISRLFIISYRTRVPPKFSQESVITTCLFTTMVPIICNPLTNSATIYKSITIPPTTPPTTTNGKLIQIVYLIEVVLDLSMDALVSDKNYNRKKHKEGKPLKLGKYGLAFDIPVVIATVAWDEAIERDPRNLIRRGHPPTMEPHGLVRAGSAPSLMARPRQDSGSPHATPPPYSSPRPPYIVHRSMDTLATSRSPSITSQHFQSLPSYTTATAPSYSPSRQECSLPAIPWTPPPTRDPHEFGGHLGVMTHQNSVRRPSAPDISEVFDGMAEQVNAMHLGVTRHTQSVRRPSAPNIGDIMGGEQQMNGAFGEVRYADEKCPVPLLQHEVHNSMGVDEDDETYTPESVYYDDVDPYATGLISARRFGNREEEDKEEDEDDDEDESSEQHESESPPQLFITIPPTPSPASDEAKLAPRMVSPLSSPDEPDFPLSVPRREMEVAELPMEEGSVTLKPDEVRYDERPRNEVGYARWVRAEEKPHEAEAKPNEFEGGEAASSKEEVALWAPPLPPRRSISVVPAPMPPPVPPRPTGRELERLNRFSSSKR
ncbi:hypothetical protein BC937DRAFT_88585 [Endogone sp. FLAS-F59071]|nr:hypothetical protein BC937DRAFT_88585 [Endogone sp. FLAS-F59071]|eukprot:RUS18595.1 hypothetical protein BC937DRAFT_88585 [Endogone sp. FLAS-F59071]